MAKNRTRNRKRREMLRELFPDRDAAPGGPILDGETNAPALESSREPHGGFNAASGKWDGYKKEKVFCIHEGREAIIVLPSGATLAAAKMSQVALDIDVALVVRAADGFSELDELGGAVLSLPPQYQDLKQFEVRAPMIRIRWSDYGIPMLYPKFWLALAEKLPTHGRTVCACDGGHGRTGTMLACLVVAADATWTAKEAIDYVREAHCKKAVETLRQEQYVAAVERARDTTLPQ